MFKIKLIPIFFFSLCFIPSILLANSNKITFGFLPYFSASKLIELHSPIVDYIQKEIGQEISMVSAPNFKEFQKRTKDGGYDLVYTAPHMARLAELESNYQWVYMSTHRGRPIFLARQNSEVSTLKDLKNKKISLPPIKAINHHVALKALKEFELFDNKNVIVVVTPSHSSALLSLLNEQVAVAVMGNAPWNTYKKEYQDRVKVISTSADFPGFIVMANPNLPKSIINKIKTAAINFTKTKAGKMYLQETGLKGLAPINKITMEELDPYVEAIFGIKINLF